MVVFPSNVDHDRHVALEVQLDFMKITIWKDIEFMLSHAQNIFYLHLSKNSIQMSNINRRQFDCITKVHRTFGRLRSFPLQKFTLTYEPCVSEKKKKKQLTIFADCLDYAGFRQNIGQTGLSNWSDCRTPHDHLFWFLEFPFVHNQITLFRRIFLCSSSKSVYNDWCEWHEVGCTCTHMCQSIKCHMEMGASPKKDSSNLFFMKQTVYFYKLIF